MKTKQQLTVELEKFLDYYKNYPNENRKNELLKIKNSLENQVYKIGVIANMSAGKSTFVNSFLGENILPSFNQATTDCAVFIYSKPNIEKKAIIYFEDKQPLTIKENLEYELKQYSRKDEDCEEKYRNVEKIELFYPFKNIQNSNEDFEVVFIDTPGPNSTGEYKQKHKDQTRAVLNEVDLALFLFDYDQLDANLQSDEQGLWKSIEKRVKKDKNFDIYFILNKIDGGLKDNLREIYSRDNYEEEAKKLWFNAENKAIYKLSEAAKNHNIENPKIYPISAKYGLLDRIENKSFDEEDEFDIFLKIFKRVFKEKYKNEFKKYVGIEKLENDINEYIDKEIKSKILQKINYQMDIIYFDETKELKTKITILETPQKEALEKIKKTENFLNKESKQIKKKFENELDKIKEKYLEKIKIKVNEYIDEEFYSKIDEATQRTLLFFKELGNGIVVDKAIILAKHSELNIKKTKESKGFIDKIVETTNQMINNEELSIKIKDKTKVKIVEKGLTNFIVSLLEDYKNNYLDIKTDIKNIYMDSLKKMQNLFFDYKKKFNLDFEENLNIKIEEFNIDANITILNIKLPESVLDYQHKDEIWSKGGSFSEKKQIQQEEHILTINSKNVFNTFKNIIGLIKRSALNKELQGYQKVLENYKIEYFQKFENFENEKVEEVKNLKESLSDVLKNLEITNKQLLVLERVKNGNK